MARRTGMGGEEAEREGRGGQWIWRAVDFEGSGFGGEWILRAVDLEGSGF